MSARSIGAEELGQAVRRILPQAQELRHRLHRIPEVGLQERRTAEELRSTLAALAPDAELLPPYLETDVTGLVRGRAPAAGGTRPSAPATCVLLRADMDALPMETRDRPECASAARLPGTTAATISRTMAVLAGPVRRRRQLRLCSSQERRSAGAAWSEGPAGGAPTPAAVFALHGWGMPKGACVPGLAMAAADQFAILVRGRGGHGAKPHLAIDPILTAAQIVTSLQGIVARNVDPLVPAVISVCTFRAGSATNVIPSEARLEGTVRYFDPDLKHLLRTRLEEVVRGVCEAAGAEHQFEYRDGYIPAVNDPGQVAFARAAVQAHLGPASWHEGLEAHHGRGGLRLLSKIPGPCSCSGWARASRPLHHPNSISTTALEPGIRALAALALETL
jgi:metal-dependent amidase/aminoacylase/carboxypeptidase family protein